MTKNPFLNAIAAACYIAVIVSAIYYAPHSIDQKATVLIPMGMLSLFVLSAATMGYIFLYQPITMYIDGKKKEAVNLFLKTLGSFALITILFFVTFFVMALR